MKNIIAQGDKYLLPVYNKTPVEIVSGKGSYLIDINGKYYLDFTSGVAVNNLGYANKKLISIIKHQAEKLIHCSNLYYEKNQIEYAKALVKNTGYDKVFFCCSGSEAIDAAIKIARKASKATPSKTEVLSLSNGFHGRTYGALSISNENNPPFEPILPNCKIIDENNILTSINASTCAVVVELVQGHAGAKLLNSALLKQIQEKCRENDALFIVDEAQTAFGRLGSSFGFKLFKLKPDIVVIAKTAGGGLPLAALLLNKKTSRVLSQGEHGSTFGGNPIACALGKELLVITTRPAFTRKVLEKGEYFKKKLLELKNKHRTIKEVNGISLMLGLTLYNEIPNLKEICRENGLLLFVSGNKIRFLPPLTITKKEIDKAVSVLDFALSLK